jgi:hypothetical protein
MVPSRTLATRIPRLDIASSDIVEKLDEPWDKMSRLFPQQPRDDLLHIIVQLPSGECCRLCVPVVGETNVILSSATKRSRDSGDDSPPDAQKRPRLDLFKGCNTIYKSEALSDGVRSS